ncbi:MAG: hypothetical protein L6V88_10655 [Anaerotruncus sp.]|nr:MAG: hypothetical protein L6V88_10655 [Anaerotruncus sp.]
MHKNQKTKKGFFSKPQSIRITTTALFVRHCGFAAICRSAAALYAGIY